MIKRTFICAADHTTHPWVNAEDDLEAKKNAGELECHKTLDDGSECKALIVEIPLAAPGINSGVSRAANRKRAPAEKTHGHVVMVPVASYENVGTDFAREARAMDEGRSDKAGIFGVATKDEAAQLKRDGVEFRILPNLDKSRLN